MLASSGYLDDLPGSGGDGVTPMSINHFTQELPTGSFSLLTREFSAWSNSLCDDSLAIFRTNVGDRTEFDIYKRCIEHRLERNSQLALWGNKEEEMKHKEDVRN